MKIWSTFINVPFVSMLFSHQDKVVSHFWFKLLLSCSPSSLFKSVLYQCKAVQTSCLYTRDGWLTNAWRELHDHCLCLHVYCLTSLFIMMDTLIRQQSRQCVYCIVILNAFFSCVCEKSQLSCTVCVKGGWGREFYIKNLLWASVQVQSRTSFGACELGEVGLELKFQAWARFSCGYMKTNEVSECVGCVLAVKNCESRDVTFVLHCLQPGWQICMYIYLPTLYVIRSLYST